MIENARWLHFASERGRRHKLAENTKLTDQSTEEFEELGGLVTCFELKLTFYDKVITTMVIDDPTCCAQSVVADLRPLGLGYVRGRGWAQSIARPWVPISSILTYMVCLLPYFVN